MKAISVRQPWASYLADGSKTIETHYWSTEHRGDLLIVSSKRPKIEDLPTGQALCVVTLIDCRPMTQEDVRPARCAHYPGAYSWVFKDKRPIEPFNVTGRLKIYEVDDDLIEMDCRNCNGISVGCEADGLCIVKKQREKQRGGCYGNYL